MLLRRRQRRRRSGASVVYFSVALSLSLSLRKTHSKLFILRFTSTRFCNSDPLSLSAASSSLLEGSQANRQIDRPAVFLAFRSASLSSLAFPEPLSLSPIARKDGHLASPDDQGVEVLRARAATETAGHAGGHEHGAVVSAERKRGREEVASSFPSFDLVFFCSLFFDHLLSHPSVFLSFSLNSQDPGRRAGPAPRLLGPE